MKRLWYELGWSSLDDARQINTTTKKHLTKDEQRQKRKVARASRKRNRK